MTAVSARERLFTSAASASSRSRRVAASAADSARPCLPRSFRWIRRSASSSGIPGAFTHRAARDASIASRFARAFAAASASSAEPPPPPPAEAAPLASAEAAPLASASASAARVGVSASFVSVRKKCWRTNVSLASMLSARSPTKHRGTGSSIASGVRFASAETSSGARASTSSFSRTIQCLVSRTRPAHASIAAFTASRFCGWHIWSHTSSRSRKMRTYAACAAANSRRPRGSSGGSGVSSGFAPSPPEGPGGRRTGFAAASAGSSSSTNGSSLSICTSRSRMDARHSASNVLRGHRAGVVANG